MHTSFLWLPLSRSAITVRAQWILTYEQQRTDSENGRQRECEGKTEQKPRNCWDGRRRRSESPNPTQPKRARLYHALCAPGQHAAKRRRKCTRQTRSCWYNFDIYSHRFKKSFTCRLSNKPFLIWLLTTPPHLKYVATLPCNLSLMACFADINVSQDSVATHTRCDGSFNTH